MQQPTHPTSDFLILSTTGVLVHPYLQKVRSFPCLRIEALNFSIISTV